MSADAVLTDYYARRAHEYERIYEKPERQRDLEILAELFQQTFADQCVLEVACGTGFWTQIISKTAGSIIATDINDEVLAIARNKKYGCKVSFQKADAFDLAGRSTSDLTAGMAAAWWSHLRKEEIETFLSNFHRSLPPASLVVFMDNKFVPGSSTPISRRDIYGNTFQERVLSDGHKYEVVKNFPDEREVLAALADSAMEIRWKDLDYYWFLTYRIKHEFSR